MKEKSFEEKLYEGHFQNDLKYPSLVDVGGDILKRDQARSAYRRRESEIREEFKQGALKALNLTEHPKAELLWDMAWEDGHASGLMEVWITINRYAQLLK